MFPLSYCPLVQKPAPTAPGSGATPCNHSGCVGCWWLWTVEAQPFVYTPGYCSLADHNKGISIDSGAPHGGMATPAPAQPLPGLDPCGPTQNWEQVPPGICKLIWYNTCTCTWVGATDSQSVQELVHVYEYECATLLVHVICHDEIPSSVIVHVCIADRHRNGSSKLRVTPLAFDFPTPSQHVRTTYFYIC